MSGFDRIDAYLTKALEDGSWLRYPKGRRRRYARLICAVLIVEMGIIGLFAKDPLFVAIGVVLVLCACAFVLGLAEEPAKTMRWAPRIGSAFAAAGVAAYVVFLVIMYLTK